jgi:hypothetical protein
LNEFELKMFEFEKSFKKKKKGKKTLPSFQPGWPTGPSPRPAAAHLPASFFFFFCAADTPTPLVGAPFSFLPPPFPYLCPAVTDRDTDRARPSPLALVSIFKSR